MFASPLPQRLAVGDISAAYWRQGHGQSLLYLHGCHGVEEEDPFLAPLSKAFDVIAPAMPGFGDTGLPRTFRGIEDAVDFCVQFCAALNLRKTVLVGSSFGGWVAAELALRYTDYFSYLVLADPVGARFSADPEEKEILDVFIQPPDAIPGVFFNDSEAGKRAFMNMNFAAMPEEALERYCRCHEGLTLYGWSPLLNNPRLKSRLARIDLPTLVLWGAQDKVVSMDYGRKYADAIPGAAFDVIENAGHYLPLEQAEAFAERITSFAS